MQVKGNNLRKDVDAIVNGSCPSALGKPCILKLSPCVWVVIQAIPSVHHFFLIVCMSHQPLHVTECHFVWNTFNRAVVHTCRDRNAIWCADKSRLTVSTSWVVLLRRFCSSSFTCSLALRMTSTTSSHSFFLSETSLAQLESPASYLSCHCCRINLY